MTQSEVQPLDLRLHTAFLAIYTLGFIMFLDTSQSSAVGLAFMTAGGFIMLLIFGAYLHSLIQNARAQTRPMTQHMKISVHENAVWNVTPAWQRRH